MFDAPSSSLPHRSIAKALTDYRMSGGTLSFCDLKYSCFGIAQKLMDGWCLFHDDTLFFKLLDQVEAHRAVPRRFRKCYQGLLLGYFNYEKYNNKLKTNWKHLRDYLAHRLPDAKQSLPVANWLFLLEEHQNLLGPKPCERYAKELRDGNKEFVYQALQEGLGIQKESWVWQEIVLSQIKVACGCEDSSFINQLDSLLNMLQGQSVLSTNLVIHSIAMMVSRYAQCSLRPEHPLLRDVAVANIGNPWLKKTAWDARVRTADGQPHTAAREMISGWIKRELIKEFFELLSEDGLAVRRRLKYWLRFEPVIDDMWFALGPDANNHPSNELQEFQKRAAGRLLQLAAGGGGKNNAFIMRMGAITVVEFGLQGNAAYIYKSDNSPFDLSKNLVNSFELKNQRLGERFIHRDSQGTGGRWEKKLDNILSPRIGYSPAQEGATRRRSNPVTPGLTRIMPTENVSPILVSPWEQQAKILAIKYNLQIIDNRSKGGAFWIMEDNARHWELAQLGFEYRLGKGWCKD